MSIAKCFASLGYEISEENASQEAAQILMEQFNLIKEMSPTAELIGLENLIAYLEQSNEDENNLYNIESLYDESAADFLSIDKNFMGKEQNPDSNSGYLFGYSNTSEMPAADVLENIKLRFPSMNPIVQAIVDQMVPLLNETKATVKFVADSRISDGAFMQYDPNTNTILVSKEKVDKVSAPRAVTAMLHEIVHSLTVHTYAKSNKTPQEQAFRDLIDDMWKKYKDLSGYSNLSFNERQDAEFYGFKQPEEFIAELMTNPAFQNKIKELERNNPPSENLWRQFVRWINKLLGIQNTPEYDAAISAITQAIVNNTANPANEAEAMAFLNIEVGRDPGDLYEEETVSKKLKATVDIIKDNLDESIRRYDGLIKTAKDPAKIKRYATKLKQILNKVEQYDNTRQWSAVAYFISEVNNSLALLERAFANEKFDIKSVNRTIHQYDKYLQSYALLADIQEFLSQAYASQEELPITAEEFTKMREDLRSAKSYYDQLQKDFDEYLRTALISQLNNRKYAYEVIVKREEKYRKQHRELGLKEPVENYINRMLNVVDKEEVDREVEDHITKLIRNPQMDISWATSYFNSGMNTNSKLIQLFQTIAGEVRNNIIERQRAKDLEMRDLFEEFIQGKKSMKMSELYKNMLEFDADGQGYLKGEYSIEFRRKHQELLQKYNADLVAAKEKYGAASAEYRNIYKESEYKKWREANTLRTPEGKVIPHPKWKNNLSGMSEVEKKVLDYFKNITETTHKQTFGFRSLIEEDTGAEYYRLPSVTRSDLERVTEGNLKGIVDDKWRNLSESVRPDDVGYEEGSKKTEKSVEAAIGMDKKPIHRVKVNFRSKLKPDQQSLDLFTIYRLEMKNGINYQEKQQAEMTLGTLVDIAGEKKYYRTSGIRVPVLGKFVKRRKRLIIDGQESNTYKRLTGLLEQNVYDIMHKHAGKVGKVDINKVVRVLNGYTAGLGMTLNEVTATANVLNGKAQLFLESIAGTHIKGRSLAKAEKVYFGTMIENFKDVNSPIKSSFVNQLTEDLDTFGLISVSAKQAFIKNTLFKATANAHSLQFMQEGGEHWLQSVLTMAILDSIQVMNKDNQLIDKNGNPVKNSKDAASLLDMYSLDANGKLALHPSVVYTTKSTGVAFDKGGKEKVMALVKKKIFDTMGNYDSNMQPEAMRHWHGKLLMMYRKYLIPMGLARFRGMVHADQKVEDLEDYQRFYSEALQLYEEGFYTSAARYFMTGVLPALRKMQFDLMTARWHELTDYERANIYKFVTEMIITSVLLPTIGLILEGAMATGDDDSDKFLYFLLLETRRLESELSAYRDPREQYRITNSPIPAVRTLENATNLIDRLISPNKLGEKYKAGPRKGKLKIYKDIERLVPILNSTNITYKEKYEYIVNMTQ